jgi:hypothetical protein
LRIVSSLADDSATPGMTNEDHRTILQPDHPTGGFGVVRQRSQRILDGDRMKSAWDCFIDRSW